MKFRRAISCGLKSRVPLGMDGFCAIILLSKIIMQRYELYCKNRLKIKICCETYKLTLADSEKIATFRP